MDGPTRSSARDKAALTFVTAGPTLRQLEIAEIARKHGIDDQDIHHAVRNPIRVLPGEDRDLVIGADRTGRLLEIVVLDDDPHQEPVIIHAMPIRPKFHHHLS